MTVYTFDPIDRDQPTRCTVRRSGCRGRFDPATRFRDGSGAAACPYCVSKRIRSGAATVDLDSIPENDVPEPVSILADALEARGRGLADALTAALVADDDRRQALADALDGDSSSRLPSLTFS